MTLPSKATFTFGEYGDVHEIGNIDCHPCRSWGSIPEKCECGGLIHTTFVDETWDDETEQEGLEYLTKCDICGKKGS